MKKIFYLTCLTFFCAKILYAQPQYASSETKEVIEKMITAHGGMKKWKDLKTLTFTSAMHSKSLGFLRFWIKSQTIDMQSRRSYQDWPIVGSKLSYDGQKVWTTDWRVGNPPNHQHSVYYYYVNLPWLTQDSNVKLGDVEKIKHQAFKNEVYKIKMSFSKAPTVGKSVKDSYTLYIDSKSYLLNGYEYTVGYGPLLDILKLAKNKTFFGPVLRINNYTGDVKGLKFPMLMTTNSLDLKDQYGDHVIYDFKIDEKFDETRMIKSDKDIIDTSTDNRK
ncbi:DUF6503 family protein [Tenacibaculum sp. MEBiC06402]|uniref:DUF6503 family protein n=1 Tax=unclassified Tenacibaculum TaxID=2635139 RepID=UPI003B9ABF9E